MSPKKPAPKSDGVKGRLNRGYEYGQQHVFTVALVSLGLGAVLAVFTFLGFLNEREIEKRVTRVESICTRFPGSDKCQLTKQRSDEKRSVSSTCVLAYKLDKEGRLLRLTKCPVEPKRQKRIEAEEAADTSGPTASVASPNGGDAPQPPMAHQQPGRHEGGSRSTEVDGNGGGVKESPGNSTPPKVPTEHGGGGEGVPSNPPASSPSAPGGSSSSTTVERVKESVVEAPSPEAVPPVTKGLGEVLGGVGHVVTEPGATVEEAGHGVDETVHGVTCQLGIGQC